MTLSKVYRYIGIFGYICNFNISLRNAGLIIICRTFLTNLVIIFVSSIPIASSFQDMAIAIHYETSFIILECSKNCILFEYFKNKNNTEVSNSGEPIDENLIR